MLFSFLWFLAFSEKMIKYQLIFRCLTSYIISVRNTTIDLLFQSQIPIIMNSIIFFRVCHLEIRLLFLFSFYLNHN